MKRPAKGSQKAPAFKPSGAKDRISEQDYEELKATFDLFDEDGSGSIDTEEISKVMEELGLHLRNPVVGAILMAIKDAGRPIGWEEFLDMTVRTVGDCKTPDGLATVFGHYDKNGDGFIDLDDWKQVARSLGETMNEEEIIEMMHNAYILNNLSSNEAVNQEEFVKVVNKYSA